MNTRNDPDRPAPRLVAFHEAGHAFFSWLFCEVEGVGGLSIKRRAKSAGRWKGGRRMSSELLAHLEASAFRDGQVTRAVISALAGPGAENKASGDDGTDDWVGMLDMGHCGGDQDYEDALAFALIGRSPAEAHDYLEQVGFWIDQLYLREDVWGAISALAEALERRRYIPFPQHYQIMDKAFIWKKKKTPAVKLLGKRWFNLLCPEDKAISEASATPKS